MSPVLANITRQQPRWRREISGVGRRGLSSGEMSGRLTKLLTCMCAAMDAVRTYQDRNREYERGEIV